MRSLSELRTSLHNDIGERIVRYFPSNNGLYPSFADKSSRLSVQIANDLADRIGFAPGRTDRIAGQRSGSEFESLICQFVQGSFDALEHLRPGNWRYLTTQTQLSNFVQYRHIAAISELVRQHESLASALGDSYVVTPDIVVARTSASHAEVNLKGVILDDPNIARLTPFLDSNRTSDAPFLHASISCKWTIRSDRSQNIRTEALNLIRHRKGRAPHIVAVTAEPLPSRITSLALGTGDLDCVYHFALHELREACGSAEGAEDQAEKLEMMIDGYRLRDISDLPFDLVI